MAWSGAVLGPNGWEVPPITGSIGDAGTAVEEAQAAAAQATAGAAAAQVAASQATTASEEALGVVQGISQSLIPDYRSLDSSGKTHIFSAFDANGNRLEQGYADTNALHWNKFVGDSVELRRALIGDGTLFSYRTLIPGDMFFVDGEMKIVAVSGGDGDPSADVAAIKAELAAARGSRSTLADRMAVEVDAYGNPVTASWGLFRLRQTHMKMRRILAGKPGQLNVPMIGDSTTYLPNATSPLALGLRAVLGNAGGGLVNTLETNSGTPFSVQGEVNQLLKSGTWTRVAAASNMPDMGYMWSTEALSSVTFPFQASFGPFTSCDLIYLPSEDGVIQYRWGSGAWTELSLTSGTGPSKLPLSLPSVFPSSLTIQVVSGRCNIGGVLPLNNANGARVHKLGQNGSTAGGWAARNEAEWVQALQLLDEQDLYIICLSTNDQINRTPAAIAASLLTLRNRTRLAHPASDCLIVQPPENQNGRATLMKDITKAVRQMCVENGIPFLDLQYVFGDTVAEYSTTSPRNWQPDLTHPDAELGGPAWADAILRAILFSL